MRSGTAIINYILYILLSSCFSLLWPPTTIVIVEFVIIKSVFIVYKNKSEIIWFVCFTSFLTEKNKGLLFLLVFKKSHKKNYSLFRK